MTLRRLGPERGEQAVDLAPGAVVGDALRAAGIAAETVLVARAADHQVVPDDEPVRDGEVLLVTRVVTGGRGRSGGYDGSGGDGSDRGDGGDGGRRCRGADKGSSA